MLKPSETVHKLLLSTPCRFTGEHAGTDFVVTHAWPGYANGSRLARFDGSSLSRQFLVVAFRTGPLEKAPGVVIPNYEPTGEFGVRLRANKSSRQPLQPMTFGADTFIPVRRLHRGYCLGAKLKRGRRGNPIFQPIRRWHEYSTTRLRLSASNG